LKTNKIFALCIIGIALLLLLQSLNVLMYINIFTILLTLALLAVIVYSIKKLNYFGIFIPLAFLLLTYGRFLNVFVRVPSLLLLSSFIIALGFVLLTREHTDNSHFYFLGKRDMSTLDNHKANELDIFSSFGFTKRHINAGIVDSLFLKNVAGNCLLEVEHFIHEKTIEVEIENKFGTVTLSLEEDVDVAFEVDNILGNNDLREQLHTNKKLLIKGDNILGNINIVRR